MPRVKSATELQYMKGIAKTKMDKPNGTVIVSGKTTIPRESVQADILNNVKSELEKTDKSMQTKYNDFDKIKKAYLDMEENPDPYYVDYNLLFSNVNLMMSLGFTNEMKACFAGTNEADLMNADYITKTADYDWREEMDMDINSYLAGMDKNLGGYSLTVFNGWKSSNAPEILVAPLENCRLDPKGHTHEKFFRWLGFFGYMTKAEMRRQGFFNVEKVYVTSPSDKTKKEDTKGMPNGLYDQDGDESAKYYIYNHFRTLSDGRKCLVTTANNNSLLVRYVELDYKIGERYVFPRTIDYRKPQEGNPTGIRPYDLTGRKQNVLSLLLNLAVKKAVRSSLGDHMIVDSDSVINKDDLKNLTEFPEIILFNSHKGLVAPSAAVSTLQRTQVPADNFNMFSHLSQLNQIETAIGPNMMGISPTGDQTKAEVLENASNANTILSLTNRISFISTKDFRQKRYMMYYYHFPEDGQKLIMISNDYGDRYMTFKRRDLTMGGDPHVKIVSRIEQMSKNKQQLANHIAIHAYIEQFSQLLQTNLAVRLSLRQILREMGYNEDQIYDFVPETYSENDAKMQLMMLNKGKTLPKIESYQMDEEHDVYLHIFKQAKDGTNKLLAIQDRMRRWQQKKKAEIKQPQQQQPGQDSNALNSTRNQMTANMIKQGGDNPLQQIQ